MYYDIKQFVSMDTTVPVITAIYHDHSAVEGRQWFFSIYYMQAVPLIFELVIAQIYIYTQYNIHVHVAVDPLPFSKFLRAVFIGMRW